LRQVSGTHASLNPGYQAVDYTGEVPRVSVGVIENSGAAGGNNNGQLDVGDIATQTFITTRSNQEHDLNQFRVGGSWNPADGIDVDFGVGYSASEMNQSNAGTLDFLGGWGVGLNDIPDTSFLETVDVASHFRDFDVSGVDGASGIVPPEYVLVSLGAPAFRNDPYEFPRSLSPYERADGTVFDFNNRTPNGSNDRTIKEDIKSLYVSANFDGEIAGFNTETVVGLRYEETDVVSSTLQAVPTGITWTSDNDFRVNFSDQPQELTEEFSYSNVLPSVDFAVDARDDLKLRFSVSQTIARPEYGDMFVNTSVSGPNTLTALGGISNASRGTARLEPLESTNFDVSAEWYYGDSSYISGGYFRKSVNNFVGTEVVSQPLFDLRDPTAGTDGTRSGQAIEGSSFLIRLSRSIMKRLSLTVLSSHGSISSEKAGLVSKPTQRWLAEISLMTSLRIRLFRNLLLRVCQILPTSWVSTKKAQSPHVLHITSVSLS